MDGDLPEHAKLMAIKDESHVIGQFIEWLQSHGYEIAYWHGDNAPYLVPERKSIEAWLARYFRIDLAALEAEKWMLLKEQREVTRRHAERNKSDG